MHHTQLSLEATPLLVYRHELLRQLLQVLDTRGTGRVSGKDLGATTAQGTHFLP